MFARKSLFERFARCASLRAASSSMVRSATFCSSVARCASSSPCTRPSCSIISLNARPRLPISPAPSSGTCAPRSPALDPLHGHAERGDAAGQVAPERGGEPEPDGERGGQHERAREESLCATEYSTAAAPSVNSATGMTATAIKVARTLKLGLLRTCYLSKLVGRTAGSYRSAERRV